MGIAQKNSSTPSGQDKERVVNGHGSSAAHDNETCCHARSPHPNPLPQAGEGANVSLREFHVNGLIRPPCEYPHK